MYLGCRALVAVANTHTYRCVGRDTRYPQPERCDALAKDSEAGPSMKLNPGHRGGLGSIQIHCCPIGKEVLSSVPAAMGTPPSCWELGVCVLQAPDTWLIWEENPS